MTRAFPPLSCTARRPHQAARETCRAARPRRTSPRGARSPKAGGQLAALLAGALSLGLAAGCAAEGLEIHLVLVSDLLVPEEVDHLDVTVTASQTAEPVTCSPETFSLELAAADDEGEGWPRRVAVRAGETFSAWLAFRVVAVSSGDEVLRREGLCPWPSEGYREVEVELSSRCLGRQCGRNEHCVDGQCHGVPEPDVFEAGAPEDDRESCVENDE